MEENLMFKYTIPIEPRTKKNSQQIITTHGRPIIIPSAAYKKYEKEAIWHLQNGKPETPIDYPVNVECKFYMGTRRRVDLNNLLECATDVLVLAGVLLDDNSNIVVSHDGSRVHYDKENPRTEIVITEVGDG
jgi:Holliday junction resolvase RusA-like endonuclease